MKKLLAALPIAVLAACDCTSQYDFTFENLLQNPVSVRIVAHGPALDTLFVLNPGASKTVFKTNQVPEPCDCPCDRADNFRFDSVIVRNNAGLVSKLDFTSPQSWVFDKKSAGYSAKLDASSF